MTTGPAAEQLREPAVESVGAAEAGSGRRAAQRQARVARRRAQVLDAAARIMYDTGYHGMSMQAVADRAGMSVGLIYQYFAGKEDILEAVIVEILDEFRVRVPAAMDASGTDPEDRLRAGFAALCAVIDSRREATLLAYRESQTLSPEGRATLFRMEEETIEPFREAIEEGIARGRFRRVSPELVAHNLKMAAHAWALKHWALSRHHTLQQYVDAEIDLTLCAVRA